MSRRLTRPGARRADLALKGQSGHVCRQKTTAGQPLHTHSKTINRWLSLEKTGLAARTKDETRTPCFQYRPTCLSVPRFESAREDEIMLGAADNGFGPDDKWDVVPARPTVAEQSSQNQVQMRRSFGER